MLEEVSLLWGVNVCDASSKQVHPSSTLRTLWPVIGHDVWLCLPLFFWDPVVLIWMTALVSWDWFSNSLRELVPIILCGQGRPPAESLLGNE